MGDGADWMKINPMVIAMYWYILKMNGGAHRKSVIYNGLGSLGKEIYGVGSKVSDQTVIVTPFCIIEMNVNIMSSMAICDGCNFNGSEINDGGLKTIHQTIMF